LCHKEGDFPIWPGIARWRSGTGRYGRYFAANGEIYNETCVAYGQLGIRIPQLLSRRKPLNRKKVRRSELLGAMIRNLCRSLLRLERNEEALQHTKDLEKIMDKHKKPIPDEQQAVLLSLK